MTDKDDGKGRKAAEANGFVFYNYEPPTPEEEAAQEARANAALTEARARFREVLIIAGVPVSEADSVLAGLEAQGYKPDVTTGIGILLAGGMLMQTYGNPNAVRHDSVQLRGGPWYPLEAPPDPPWVYCAYDPEFNRLPPMERCTNPEHGPHSLDMVNGSMHRATPAEVAQLAVQTDPTPKDD